MTGGDFSIQATSPAIGRGTPMAAPLIDFLGQPFNMPPSIGAVEGNPPVSGINGPTAPELISLSLHPQPSTGNVSVSFSGLRPGPLRLVVFDIVGRPLLRHSIEASSSSARVHLDLTGARLLPGLYHVLVSDGARSAQRPLLLLR